MVIMVLLNDALTCATPDVMFFFSRFLTLPRAAAVASLAITIRAPGLLGGEKSQFDRARRHISLD
jgi:hypothetical protein